MMTRRRIHNDSTKKAKDPTTRPSSSFCMKTGRDIGDTVSSSVAAQLKKYGYTLDRSIGQGTYCKVKTAFKDIEGGDAVKKVACKIIDKKKASNDFIKKFLPRELFIVRELRHPNIVTVFDLIDMPRYVYLFMDLCERGDLLDYIELSGPLSDAKSRHFFQQIVSAVEYLHSLNIAHRDLKCENILMSSKNNIKITDFGFARWCCNEKGKRILSKTFCGSTAYAAPEILLGMPYNPKLYDSWSLGCILFIMLTKTMPYIDKNMKFMIEAQQKSLVYFPHDIGINPSAQRLIFHLLEPDVTRRATVRQILKSSWMCRPKSSSSTSKPN